jgi:hypothetical protein
MDEALRFLGSWLSNQHFPPASSQSSHPHSEQDPSDAFNNNNGTFQWQNMRDPTMLTLFFATFYSVVHLGVETGLVKRRVDPKLLSTLSRPDRFYIAEK